MTTTSSLDRTTGPFVRRFLADYVRNPVNVLLLVVVPAVFVLAAAGALAEAADLLGGPGGPSVQVVSAGWAAGVLAAVGMYFQIRGARAADRRIVLAGLPTARLVTARLVTGLALTTHWSRSRRCWPWSCAPTSRRSTCAGGHGDVRPDLPRCRCADRRLVRSPVNGTVLILFVWIADVFFGPLFGGIDRLATRALPTHFVTLFVTLWMVDLPSRHAGRPGDIGWAVAWTIGALALSWAVIAATSRVGRAARRSGCPASPGRQLTGLLAAGLRERAPTPVLAVLLVIVPAVFIPGAVAVTPEVDLTLRLTDRGRNSPSTCRCATPTAAPWRRSRSVPSRPSPGCSPCSTPAPPTTA
jgi:hypothetical protein